MTSGAPSCPRKTPVEQVQAGAILWTLSVLICLSSEYLVLAKLPAGITHWFGSAAIFASSSFATAYPAVNRAAAPKQLASKSLRIVSSRLDLFVKPSYPRRVKAPCSGSLSGTVSAACHDTAKRADARGDSPCLRKVRRGSRSPTLVQSD